MDIRYSAGALFSVLLVLVIRFAFVAVRARIERRKTVDRLFKLCAVRATYGPLPNAKVSERANVA